MNKWEYSWLSLNRERTFVGTSKPWFLFHPDGKRVEGQQINERIEQIGDEGWELVSVVPISSFPTFGGWIDELQ